MEIRLIAADMDGTLLDDEKKIPEENLRVFRECAARGIEIVPATGRTMRGLPDELRNLPGVHYAILTICSYRTISFIVIALLSW